MDKLDNALKEVYHDLYTLLRAYREIHFAHKLWMNLTVRPLAPRWTCLVKDLAQFKMLTVAGLGPQDAEVQVILTEALCQVEMLAQLTRLAKQSTKARRAAEAALITASTRLQALLQTAPVVALPKPGQDLVSEGL